ncbi:MAG TPA: helix-turn-helix domain-containing protein [Acidimicrobiales bacterium]|nr:helix-turn-helix domain-containing protein [Acidimicrobiales bacterium]
MSPVLGRQEVNEVIDAAERIAAACSLDDLRAATVGTIASLTDAGLVAWNEVCPHSGRIEAVTSAALGAPVYAALGEAFAAHVGDHPVIAHHRRTGDGRPRAISDLTGLAQFHGTALYREFYRPLAATDQVSFIVPDEASIIGVAANVDSKAAVETARAVCALLRPVIVQSYRLLAGAATDAPDVAWLTGQGLSRREAQVISLVAAGWSTKRVASKLAISARTVDKHVEHARAKLGAGSRIDAASIVWRRMVGSRGRGQAPSSR